MEQKEEQKEDQNHRSQFRTILNFVVFLKMALFIQCRAELCFYNGGIDEHIKFQGTLVPKLTLGPFLTLIVRNGPNMQSYLFQPYISLLKREMSTLN